jgi:hypothetical protein
MRIDHLVGSSGLHYQNGRRTDLNHKSPGLR